MSIKGYTPKQVDGSLLRVGIVFARWHGDITGQLFAGCKQALLESGVNEQNIHVIDVPGAYDLTAGARLLTNAAVDVVVTLGCVIKGGTKHFKYVCQGVTNGIAQLNAIQDIPVVFGVLTCKEKDQAVARATGDNNHGYLWGKAAVELGLMAKS